MRLSRHLLSCRAAVIAGVLLCSLAGCGSRLSVMAPDQIVYPDPETLTSQAQLPDPFGYADGQRVTSREDWPVQRAYLLSLVERYGYGHQPEAGSVTAKETASSHDDALHATRTTVELAMGPKGVVTVHLYLIIPDGTGPFPVIIEGDRGWGAVAEPIVAAVISRGYMLAQFDRTEIAPDKADRSVGLYAAFPACDGGALAAWAWGYHRVIDCLSTRHEVDATRIAITGHSRGGKAVLLAGATDERIALVAPNGSGCMGAGCERKLFQCEDLDRIVKVFPFWFTPRLAQFSGHADRLPFDQHTLKALIAPRALLSTEGLDDLWANPRGTQITFQAAREVYRFLGAEGAIGISYRPGKHEHNLTDWQSLLDFADEHLCHKPMVRRFDVLHFEDEAKDAYTWSAP
jgi:hypothetical protein